jgi:hypothetical protein
MPEYEVVNTPANNNDETKNSTESNTESNTDPNTDPNTEPNTEPDIEGGIVEGQQPVEEPADQADQSSQVAEDEENDLHSINLESNNENENENNAQATRQNRNRDSNCCKTFMIGSLFPLRSFVFAFYIIASFATISETFKLANRLDAVLIAYDIATASICINVLMTLMFGGMYLYMIRQNLEDMMFLFKNVNVNMNKLDGTFGVLNILAFFVTLGAKVVTDGSSGFNNTGAEHSQSAWLSVQIFVFVVSLLVFLKAPSPFGIWTGCFRSGIGNCSCGFERRAIATSSFQPHPTYLVNNHPGNHSQELPQQMSV